MKIIKRSGEEVEFDASKIEAAIVKANESVAAAEPVKSIIYRLNHKAYRRIKNILLNFY